MFDFMVALNIGGVFKVKVACFVEYRVSKLNEMCCFVLTHYVRLWEIMIRVVIDWLDPLSLHLYHLWTEATWLSQDFFSCKHNEGLLYPERVLLLVAGDDLFHSHRLCSIMRRNDIPKWCWPTWSFLLTSTSSLARSKLTISVCPFSQAKRKPVVT